MPHVPSPTELISLPLPSHVRVSPDGRTLAYTVSRPNWRDNRHEVHAFVYDRESGRTRQLTRHGSVLQLEWLDAESLVVLRQDFDSPKTGKQLWLFEGLTGEAWPITDHDGNVFGFRPFAEGVLYRAGHPERRKKEARTARFGTFVHKEHETSANAVYYVSLPKLRAYLRAHAQCSVESDRKALKRPIVELSAALPEPMAIQRFFGAATGDAIYLGCRIRDDLVYQDDPIGFRLRVDPEAALDAQLAIDAETDREGPAPTDHLGELTRLGLPPGSYLDSVSPDGTTLVVERRLRDRHWYTQPDLMALDVTGPKDALEQPLDDQLVSLTADLDQDPLDARWCDQGLVVLVAEGTGGGLYLLRADAAPRRLDLGSLVPASFHVARSGRLAFVASDADQLSDVFVTTVDAESTPERVSHLHEEAADLDLGTLETIEWTSRDGTRVEGVLRKPPGYEPGKRYPLAFVVHGGPAGVSRAWLLEGADRRYYPSVALASRGVLVLKPNYRGSIGRGQAFLELNAGNLGVGDLWDLESALDTLVDRGMVDPERVGCMGWSQGGYISAMAGLRSDRFAAVSVGAGISDWYTYRVSNDIPQFTDHYLGASPYTDRAIYERTAPISGLSADASPMLVQHGENDRRVPLSNAMELYRGLQGVGVPVELFVYPGMGHGISKPRENRAVMWQNLTWFAHHLLGEPLDFFADPASGEPTRSATSDG
ncbi:MAG: prolyl oligopeptidase family serine peptidase [Myxococcota bacterium]